MSSYCRLLLLFLMILAISCHTPTTREIEVARPQYIVTGQEGAINGRVKFVGAPPANTALQFDADNYCLEHAEIKSSETVLVTDGALANVLISIKAGPALNFSYPPPAEPAELDQRGCRYQPHIQGLRTGQRLKIVNSDDTDHNIELLPKFAPLVSETQPRQSASAERASSWQTFTRAEIIPVKCKLHPWMRAYLGVFDHPFYAVSAIDGSFQISGLPPGEYQLEAWHERLGAQTTGVIVKASSTAMIEFSYQAQPVNQQ